jgi:dCMP deaminase
MLIAKLVSTRSTCNSRPTGAVLVKDRQILATGYNGSMPGAPHCIDQVMPDGSPYCHRRALNIADVDKYNYCRASHAEATAQIKRVYFELAYDSKDAARDEFWQQAVAEAGFEVFAQLTISPAALEFILPSLRGITSRRRLAATAAVAGPRFVGAVESE